MNFSAGRTGCAPSQRGNATRGSSPQDRPDPRRRRDHGLDLGPRAPLQRAGQPAVVDAHELVVAEQEAPALVAVLRDPRGDALGLRVLQHADLAAREHRVRVPRGVEADDVPRRRPQPEPTRRAPVGRLLEVEPRVAEQHREVRARAAVEVVVAGQRPGPGGLPGAHRPPARRQDVAPVLVRLGLVDLAGQRRLQHAAVSGPRSSPGNAEANSSAASWGSATSRPSCCAARYASSSCSPDARRCLVSRTKTGTTSRSATSLIIGPTP